MVSHAKEFSLGESVFEIGELIMTENAEFLFIKNGNHKNNKALLI